MREPRPGGTQEHDTTALAPAPRASHGGALVATGVLLALWIGVTVGAPVLVGPIASLATRIETTLGLDALPDPETTNKSEDDGG